MVFERLPQVCCIPKPPSNVHTSLITKAHSYCLSLGDDCAPDQCIPGDVKAFTDFGFDNLKIDGCSAQRDVEVWAELINKTGTFSEIGWCFFIAS